MEKNSRIFISSKKNLQFTRKACKVFCVGSAMVPFLKGVHKMSIVELEYREIDTGNAPYTMLTVGDYNLTITRLPGITHVIPSTPMSNEDPILLQGHPSESEIAAWWQQDLARDPKERIANYQEVVDLIQANKGPTH